MLKDPSEIVFTLVASTIMLLIIISFIVIILFIHQRRVLKHQRNIAMLQQQYQEEIMRAQMEIQEETLDFVGRELHDNIGQILSLIKLNLMHANEEQIRESRKLIGTAIHDLRTISHRLNLAWTENINLKSFIDNLIKSLHSSAKYKVNFDFVAELKLKSKEDYVLVYRMIQEIIQNIIKHAEADEIHIEMNESNLVIKDNGKGFDIVNASTTGTGMKNLKARAALIGAELSVQSMPQNGSIFSIQLKNQTYEY